MTFPRKSSKYPTDHPPYLKPPLSSSPGPPGACITPSSVMNDKTMSFLMFVPASLLLNANPDYGMVEKSSVGYETILLRTPKVIANPSQADAHAVAGAIRAAVPGRVPLVETRPAKRWRHVRRED